VSAPLVPGTPATPEDRLRELGLQVTIRFAAVLRVAAVYEPRNHVVQLQIEQLERALNEVLQVAPEAVLAALDADLYLNDIRVPSRASQYKFIRMVIDEFARRDIAGVRVEPGFEREHLNLFFEEFLRGERSGAKLLEVCRANDRARVLPVLRASTEAFSDDGDFDNTWEVEDDDETEGGARRDGILQPAYLRAAARNPYAQTVRGTRALFLAALLEDLEFRHAKRVVQPIVDAANSEEPVVVGLSTLRHHDEYTYAHAVNVCSVAATMGLVLEIDRRALADLAVAALFHDVGKSGITEEIRHAIDHFTEDEWSAVRRHSAEGAKLLARSTALNQTTLRCIRVALEHHLVPGPREETPGARSDRDPPDPAAYRAFEGYPDELAGQPMSVLSQIVAVADTFVSFQMHRSERGLLITPSEALSLALAECRGKFEDALLWALVKAVGVYPIGQMVELNDGSAAIVLSPNPSDPWRPGVRVVLDRDGRLLDVRESTLLRPMPSGVFIRRALKVEDYPPELRELAFQESRERQQRHEAA
jgi:HD-GYP domain-containing protein (c-di-GMP phosphodiesterase class II)